MRYAILGIENREFFDVRECEFAPTKKEAEEIKTELEKRYPLVLIEKDIDG